MKRLIDFFKNRIVPLLILLNLAITLPLAFWLNIWGDEAYTLHTTGGSLSYALDQALRFELQAPLYYLLLGVWRKLDGSIFWTRLFSVVCIAATIKIVFNLARKFFDDIHPGWVAAAFAFHPFSIWAAVEIRAYALVVMLSALLLLLFFDGYFAEKTLRRARVLYIIVAAIALYTHYYLGFLLVANAATLLVLKRWRALLSYMIGMVAVALCFAPMVESVRHQLTVNTYAPAKAVSFLEAAKIISWRVQEYVLPAEWEPLRFLRKWGVRACLIAVIALAGMKLLRVGAHRAALWTIFSVLCVFYLVALLLTEEGLMQTRHTAGLFLPTMLAVLALISAVGSRKILLAWALTSAGFYLLFLCAFYAPVAKTGDWQRVASFLTSSEKPGQPILVFRAYAALPLAFYYKGQNVVVPLPKEMSFDSFGLHREALTSVEEIEGVVAAGAPGEHEELWLVTDETCFYLGIDFRCEILELFVTRNYETVATRNFFGSRVRLLRRKSKP